MKIPITLLGALCAIPLALNAADSQADNSAKNARDAAGETLTPIDQSNAASDIKITADTRSLIVKDKSLSMNAKNCKVITTEGGAVTLRGPVDSEEEKTTIAGYAKSAGATSINNQLEVKESR